MVSRVTRAEVLRELVANGGSYGPERLCQLATELDLPTSDVLVIARRPVPEHLLPPDRDPSVMREFAYRVTHCNHTQLASLKDFVLSLAPGTARTDATPPEAAATPSASGRFADILDGLMRNRGFGMRQLPFTGLSLATIRGLLGGSHSPYMLQQLKAMAGPLGWRFEDLAVVADEPLGDFNDCSALCRHVGTVYIAAIPLTTPQLVCAANEADRLSRRVDHGIWRPAAEVVDCPDDRGPHPSSLTM